MANQQSLSGLSKFGDLKKRLVFLLGALVVFRIGAHIPVPGVDAVAACFGDNSFFKSFKKGR